MPRLALLAATACLAASATATPAGAVAYTKCPQTSDYELTKVKHVGCQRAAEILERFFADQPTAGFDCQQKQYPGGVTTKCRKGVKRILHQSAD